MRLGAVRERLAQIDRDDDLGAHRARGVDRQIRHHAAIDEQPPVALHRREETRHRHAGAQGGREIAVLEHDRLAVRRVGGDGPERQRQAVEIFDADGAQREQPELAAEPLAADDAAGQDESVLRHPELPARQIDEIIDLAPVRQVPALGGVAHEGVPVERERELLELVRRVAGGVEPADDRPHAGAGDAIDRHLHLLEHAQHADVSEPEGAATGENQTDTRSRRPHFGQGPSAGSCRAGGGSERDQNRADMKNTPACHGRIRSH